MSFKPGDFFLTVVDFLGVLLPGAIILFLLQRHLPQIVQWRNWTVFAVAAFVLGQLLLALTEALNATVDYIPRPFGKTFQNRIIEVESQFRREHADLMSPAERNLPAGTWKDRASCFHTALSYVRLRSDAAVGEIDRHMADYKLFRNLVAVLLLMAVVSFVHPVGYLLRSEGWAELFLAVVMYVCFRRLYDWARFFTFDYARLLRGVRLVEKK